MDRRRERNGKSGISFWERFKARFLSRFSIRMMLVLYTVLIVVPVLVLSMVLTYFVQENARNKELEAAHEMMNLVTATAKTRMDNLEKLSEVVSYSVEVVNFLSTPYDDEESFYAYNDRIAPQFKLLEAAADTSVSELTVYMYNDTIPEGYDIFRRIDSLENAETLTQDLNPNHGQWILLDGEEPAIYYVYGIYSYYGETLLAVMVANVSFEIFLPSSLSANTDVWLYRDDTVLFSSTFETDLTDGRYLTVSNDFAPLSLSVGLRQPREQSGLYVLWYVSLFFAFMLLSVGVYFLLLWRVVKDSEQLVSQVKRIVEDGFKGYDTAESQFEIAIINEEYNNIVTQVRKLVQDGVEKNLLQRDAQIQAMQYQINPHMLCNSLNIIQYQCEAQGQYEISDMVAILGKIMRYSIDDASVVTDIRSEMAHLQSYVMFQRMRLGAEQLDFVVQVDEALLDTKIIKLLLQPLVENALIHGKLKGTPIRVTVRIQRIEDRIRFQVINDGKRLSEADIGAMEALLTKKPANTRESIGLQNIHRRLVLFYGEDSGLKISTTEEGDTCICFEVMIRGRGSD